MRSKWIVYKRLTEPGTGLTRVSLYPFHKQCTDYLLTRPSPQSSSLVQIFRSVPPVLPSRTRPEPDREERLPVRKDLHVRSVVTSTTVFESLELIVPSIILPSLAWSPSIGRSGSWESKKFRCTSSILQRRTSLYNSSLFHKGRKRMIFFYVLKRKINLWTKDET